MGLPTNLGYNNKHRCSDFWTDGNNADTALVWYNVNGLSTANRTFTFNIGVTNIGLNRLDGPDGLAAGSLVACCRCNERSGKKNSSQWNSCS